MPLESIKILRAKSPDQQQRLIERAMKRQIKQKSERNSFSDFAIQTPLLIFPWKCVRHSTAGKRHHLEKIQLLFLSQLTEAVLTIVWRSKFFVWWMATFETHFRKHDDKTAIIPPNWIVSHGFSWTGWHNFLITFDLSCFSISNTSLAIATNFYSHKSRR